MESWVVFGLIFALIAIDYVLGVIGAIANDTFSSTIMRRGLWHKLSYIFALIVGIIIDELIIYFELPYIYAGAILSLIQVWIIVTEVGSILENIIKINPAMGDNSFMRIFAKAEERKELRQESVADETIEVLDELEVKHGN